MENTSNSTTDGAIQQTSDNTFAHAKYDKAKVEELFNQIPIRYLERFGNALDFLWLSTRKDSPTCSRLRDLLFLAQIPSDVRELCLALYREVTLAHDAFPGFKDYPGVVDDALVRLREQRVYEMVRCFTFWYTGPWESDNEQE